jgi:hypothetical protein
VASRFAAYPDASSGATNAGVPTTTPVTAIDAIDPRSCRDATPKSSTWKIVLRSKTADEEVRRLDVAGRE